MKNRLELLNKGLDQTKNLKECLQVNQILLLSRILKKYVSLEIYNLILNELHDHNDIGILKQMKGIATTLVKYLTPSESYSLYLNFSSHCSDTVRGWACFMLSNLEHIAFEQKLSEIQKFAKDLHFGVREWGWLSLRDQIASNLEFTINYYKKWVVSDNPYIRQFAIESIRPCGVWCSHLNLLKNNPELAIILLEKLKSDPEKYVQDSVSNWLNDASKTQPKWVKDLCQKWKKENPHLNTLRITKRALRTINSKKNIK